MIADSSGPSHGVVSPHIWRFVDMGSRLDFLLAGLGACTSMTMRLYADRKSLPLQRVTVTLKHMRMLRDA